MACQCRLNIDRTIVVCDACATRTMMQLLGMPLEQENTNQQTEAPILFTSTEHQGMIGRVNAWLDELEVATR